MSWEFLTPTKYINQGKITNISNLSSARTSVDIIEFTPRKISIVDDTNFE
jgi:hypothetical protein